MEDFLIFEKAPAFSSSESNSEKYILDKFNRISENFGKIFCQTKNYIKNSQNKFRKTKIFPYIKKYLQQFYRALPAGAYTLRPKIEGGMATIRSTFQKFLDPESFTTYFAFLSFAMIIYVSVEGYF